MTCDCEIRTGSSAFDATVADFTEARADLARLRLRIDTLIEEADATIAKWNNLAELSRALSSLTVTVDNDEFEFAASADIAPVAEAEIERVAAIEPIAEIEPVAEIAPVAEAEIEPVADTSLGAEAPVAPAVALAETIAAAVAYSEQLTLIRGIDATAAAMLNGLGISRFTEIAALTADDVAEISTLIGDTRRIARDGWIEQAAMLARGVETAHVRRLRQPIAAASIWADPAVEVAQAPSTRESAPFETPVATPPAKPVATATVVELAAIRQERRARRPQQRGTILAGRVATIAAFAAFAAAAWTGIEIADGNWQALSTMFESVRLGPIASLR